MKLKTFIASYWRVLLSAVFGIAVFCVWLFCLPFLLLAREQSQLFLWNTDYVMQRLAVPGGLAQYLGEMMVQCFLNPVYGACCYTLILLAVQGLTWYLIRPGKERTKAYLYLLSFVPSCLLWYIACNPNIPMTPVVAVLLALALMALLPKKAVPGITLSFLLIPVGYWLLGPAIILLAVYALHWLKGSLSRWQIVGSTCGMLLLLVACVLASSWIVPYPLRHLVRGIDYCWNDEKAGTYEEMIYDKLIREQDWTQIAMRYQQNPSDHPAIRNVVQLAMLNLHQITQQELLRSLWLSKESLQSISSAFMTSEVSLQIGMANISQRSAFEAMEAIPNYNKSARALRRLVETNIVTGQYEVALKYIAILKETTFYRQWAMKMEPMAKHPELISKHQFYNSLKEAYKNGKDVFFY